MFSKERGKMKQKPDRKGNRVMLDVDQTCGLDFIIGLIGNHGKVLKREIL